MLKSMVRRFLLQAGYRVGRLSTPPEHRNAFDDLQYICRNVQNPVVFDVGAHHGHVSRCFRNLFPSSRVFAFEPFLPSYEVLRRNTDGDSGVKPFNCGLSNTAGRQPLCSNIDAGTNSLLETDPQSVAVWGSGVIETVDHIEAEFETLDNVRLREAISAINLLKMDVQGAEHLVLEGGRRAIEAARINVIYSEIITLPAYQSQKSFSEALRGFELAGFRVYGLYNPSLTNKGMLRQLDAIFVHESFEF